jgi:hypothetical protein
MKNHCRLNEKSSARQGLERDISTSCGNRCVAPVLPTGVDHDPELFGLHQVAANLVGPKMPPPRCQTPLYYKFVRHPIYLGFIVAFWAAPEMTVGHLFFATVTSACVFVEIFLEERDLRELFGDDYRRSQKRVSMLIPGRKST